jgi:hypothetical protein
LDLKILRKNIVILGVSIVAIIIASLVLVSVNDADNLSKTKHDTQRWAVIVDSHEDIIAVETTSQEVWDTLKTLSINQTEMWIGGVVEEYDNYWGFRFKPDSIVVAEITIEGAQSKIREISGDLDYWIYVWSKQAYVLATVSGLHE